MWHCDQLEKFTTYAEARFVQPSLNINTPPQVRRVQYTLDVATHPKPGNWYELVKDAETGIESFVMATPKAAAPATPPQPPEQAAAPAAAPVPTDQTPASSAPPATAA